MSLEILTWYVGLKKKVKRPLTLNVVSLSLHFSKNLMDIIFIAHSTELAYLRTKLAMLSFIQSNVNNQEGVNFFLITDQPDLFSAFEIAGFRIKEIPRIDVQSIINDAHGYKNIIKLHILSKWKNSFIFFDSDIFFSKPVKKITRYVTLSTTVMQKRECKINTLPNYKQILSVCEKYGGCHSSYAFNSGILGVHSSQIHLLNIASDMAKDLYGQGLVRTAEQFSDVAVLSKSTKILTMPHFCVHYWQNAGPFHQAARNLFGQKTLDHWVSQAMDGSLKIRVNPASSKNPLLYRLDTKIKSLGLIR